MKRYWLTTFFIGLLSLFSFSSFSAVTDVVNSSDISNSNYSTVVQTSASLPSSKATSSSASTASLPISAQQSSAITTVVDTVLTNSNCLLRPISSTPDFKDSGVRCTGFTEVVVRKLFFTTGCVVKLPNIADLSAGFSIAGDCTNYTLIANAPAAPQSLAASVVSNNVSLSWSSVSGATSYLLTRNNVVLPRIAATNMTTFIDTTAPTNVSLTYKIVACGLGLCSAEVAAPPVGVGPVTSEFNSLIVNDKATLAAADFSLLSVLTRLADQMNYANPRDTITAESLFQRMWDTQNPAPGTWGIAGPKCTGNLNGFQQECRSGEGVQALNASTWINNYQPIALVNRLDLRDTTAFTHCGEMRIIYGLKANVQSSVNRNFIISEAQMPNRQPGVAAGCLPIAQFWNYLPGVANSQQRASFLRGLYFDGIASQGIVPVISKDNFGMTTGRIRTNQFMQSANQFMQGANQSWVLKEFKLAVENGLNIVKPASVKSNPYGDLFIGGNTDPRAQEFQKDFIANMGNLLTTLDKMSLKVTNDLHNNGESHASGNELIENDFLSSFWRGSQEFRNAVAQRLINSGVTSINPPQVVNRAIAMTCAGCHMPSAFGLTTLGSIGNNQSWPDSLGFVHVSDVLNGNQTEFTLSPALKTLFLPARKKDFASYLNSQGVAVFVAP